MKKFYGRVLDRASCMARLRKVAEPDRKFPDIWIIDRLLCGHKTWGMIDYLKSECGLKYRYK